MDWGLLEWRGWTPYGTVLSGTPEQRARWKRGVQAVGDALGDAVGQLYVERYFPPMSKEKMEALVSNLRVAVAMSTGRARQCDFSPPTVWSSRLAVYLGTAGAAVGLGSIWRFPYLTGTGGGSAFILVFVLASVLIATPLLAAELAVGRRSRASPPEAAGIVASATKLSVRWNIIGVLGPLAAFLLFSYYTVIAGWVFAYTWKCASGELSAAGPEQVAAIWQGFRSRPFEIGAWHGLQGRIDGNESARPSRLCLASAKPLPDCNSHGVRCGVGVI